MKSWALLIILVVCCAPLVALAQFAPADSLFPPGDSLPDSTIGDSLQPGTAMAFQSRIDSINYPAGTLIFQTVQFIAKVTPQTRYHNGSLDPANLQSFVPGQMVLVAGFMGLADTVLVDSMIALNFLPSDTTYVPSQVVVRLGPGESLADIGADPMISVVDSIPELRIYLLQSVTSGAATDSFALRFLPNPVIEEVDANYVIAAPEGVQSSQPFIDLAARGDYGGQIATQMTNLTSAHQVSLGADVTVGLLDGGVDRSHPLFAGQIITGYDFLERDDSPDDAPGGLGYGHGTFIAGLIKLIAPAAQLKVYRVLDSTGRGNGFNVAKAIVLGVNDHCRVLNLSMVMRQPHFAVEQAIRYAWQANVSIVAAAGNDSSSTPLFPASDEHVLAVAALDSTGRRALFSNFGTHIDVSAPGAWLYAPYPADKYAWWNGTSFAAPIVTGQVALLAAKFPQATVSDLVRGVKLTTHPISDLNPGMDGLLGTGIIDLAGSLQNFPQYPCGDVDGNGFGPDLADLSMLITVLTRGGPSIPYPDLANVNGSPDNRADLSDLSRLIAYLIGYDSVLNCR